MKTKAVRKYTIRNAGFRDAGTIFGLIKRNSVKLLPRAMSDIGENIDRFLVAEIGGKVVGAVSWQILPEIGLARHPSVEIKSLVVSASYRGMGIGGGLAEAAIARIKGFCSSQIVVLTFCPGFFRRLGFRRVPKRKIMHKLYSGCVNCTKYDSPFTCPEIAMVLAAAGRRRAGERGGETGSMAGTQTGPRRKQ